MQLRTFIRAAGGVLVSGTLSASVLAATASPTAAEVGTPNDATGPVGYLAQAYGSYIYTLDRKVSSGPTAYTGVACTTIAGRKSTNNTAGVDVGDLAQVGVTETSVQTIDRHGVKSARATSEIATTDLLGGLITVGAITSETTASKRGDRHVAEHDSKIASLEILGQEIDLEAGANSRIELRLPLLGTIAYIELNKQEERMVGGEFRAATTAIHIAVLADAKVSTLAFLPPGGGLAYLLPGNDLSLLGGTHIWLGQTRAHLQPPQPGYLAGEGYASRVTLADGLVESGKTAATGVPCTGGASNNSVASLDLPGVLELGVAESHAAAEITEDGLASKVVTEIAASNLLGDLIEVEAIKAVAEASRAPDGSAVELSADGTQLLGLKLGGRPVAEAEIGPNTVIDLGVATVTLNKQVRSSTSIEVTAIAVELLDDIAGLPTGSLIEIGHARAGITR